MKISYLAPKGTYCYEACIQYNKDKNYETVPCKTITETILEVIEQKTEYAIVPLENSIEGSVVETIDALLKYEQLWIQEQIILDINHCLLTQEGCTQIKEIYSHPQALAQCRNYILQNFPNCEIHQALSTANAAEIAKQKSNTACIANKACSDVYGLKILAENIQDVTHNQTRFIVIGTEKKQNPNKVSLVFSTLDEPGALYRVLGIFNIFEINLTKIESRPARTELGKYNFWVDFEGNIEDDHITVLLEQVKKRCTYFRILGTY